MDERIRKFVEEFFGKGSDPFEEMRKTFEELEKDLEVQGEGIIKEEKTPYGVKRQIGPIYYGFKITKVEDNPPKIEEWGNIGQGLGKKMIEKRKPYTEINEEEDRYEVTMETPGTEEEKINIEVGENSLIVKGGDFYNEVPFEEAVSEEGIEKTYKNGVLDLKVKKLKPD